MYDAKEVVFLHLLLYVHLTLRTSLKTLRCPWLVSALLSARTAHSSADASAQPAHTHVNGSSIEAHCPYYAVHRFEANHVVAAATDRAPRHRLRLACVEAILPRRRCIWPQPCMQSRSACRALAKEATSVRCHRASVPHMRTYTRQRCGRRGRRSGRRSARTLCSHYARNL